MTRDNELLLKSWYDMAAQSSSSSSQSTPHDPFNVHLGMRWIAYVQFSLVAHSFYFKL